MKLLEEWDSILLNNTGQICCDFSEYFCNFKIDTKESENIIRYVSEHVRDFKHYEYSFRININQPNNIDIALKV